MITEKRKVSVAKVVGNKEGSEVEERLEKHWKASQQTSKMRKEKDEVIH